MPGELEDDDSHPIPRVHVIDVVRTVQGGGAGYVLTIARPLQADPRSRLRLASKIRVYVEDFFSEESKQCQGTPRPGWMWIYVAIHKDSCPEAFEIIKQHEPWIVDNGIKLIVTTID